MAKFCLYDILVPDPSYISREDWVAVMRSMDEYEWMGDPGQRFGFVEAIEHEEILAGIFANEGRRTGYQYTEDKRPKDSSAYYSFEHLLFLIFTDTSQILLQHRNIYGYPDMGLPLMRGNYLDALAVIMRLAGINVTGRKVQIETVGKKYSQEEMYTFFLDYPVVRLEVSELSLTKIPHKGELEYTLYNPRDEMNEITWQAIADTLEVGAGNISIHAEDETIANLNKGPLTKAFAGIGEIQEIAARGDYGNIIVRKKTEDEEISIDIPPEPSIALPVLEQILNHFDPKIRRKDWELRQEKRDKLDGPLFNGK